MMKYSTDEWKSGGTGLFTLNVVSEDLNKVGTFFFLLRSSYIITKCPPRLCYLVCSIG